MSEAIKPTPGPWVAVGSGGPWEQRISIRAANWGTVAAVGVDPSLPHWDGPQRANARLIAEAGTVHHETGLTPRQLVERVKELEDTLDHMAKSMTRQLDLIAERAPGAFLDKQPVINTLRMHSQRAQKALSKALPNTVAEVK